MPIIRSWAFWALFLVVSGGTSQAQAPAGPMTPKPGASVQQAPPTSQLKLRVALVNTPVTVRDSKGNLMDTLGAGDFHITDNGVEQKITHFDFGGDPVSLLILIETSSRIEPLMPELRKTGILFTQNVIGADGEAAVVGFNDGVDKLQDFTKDADRIEDTVNRMQTGSAGAKLYDAMSVAVDMLSGRPQGTAEKPGRRRVMLVLSESVDLGSETKLGEVLRKAQLTNITIYSVGLSTMRSELHSKPRHTEPDSTTPPGTFPLPPLPGTIQTPETEALRNANIDLMGAAIWAVQHINDQVKDRAMDIATVATGGTHLSTYKDRSIENAIDEIGAELHSQYTISYAPATNDPGYHEIKVQVKGKKLVVRARPGYYIAPPEG